MYLHMNAKVVYVSETPMHAFGIVTDVRSFTSVNIVFALMVKSCEVLKAFRVLLKGVCLR